MPGVDLDSGFGLDPEQELAKVAHRSMHRANDAVYRIFILNPPRIRATPENKYLYPGQKFLYKNIHPCMVPGFVRTSQGRPCPCPPEIGILHGYKYCRSDSSDPRSSHGSTCPLEVVVNKIVPGRSQSRFGNTSQAGGPAYMAERTTTAIQMLQW